MIIDESVLYCRTLINLVPSPLVSISLSMDNVNVPLSCLLSRPIECSCLFGPMYSNNRKLFREKERQFVKLMERISHQPEFHTDDFTVVYQPFFKEASVFLGTTTPDLSVMSIDCIHLSQKGHAVSANGLWNNMMEPTGQKSLGIAPLFKNFKCPTKARPYISTYFNSV